jgi:hypothetical protein
MAMKLLNIFDHYLERGSEAHAVEAINESLSEVVDVEDCYFHSRGRSSNKNLEPIVRVWSAPVTSLVAEHSNKTAPREKL